MSNTNTGGPAFPFVLGDDKEKFIRYEQGMTLRDYFAAKAMQGELSAMALDENHAPGLPLGISDEELDTLAKHWFRIGTAMLKARAA